MGGRGSNFLQTSPEQKRLMNNLIRRNLKNSPGYNYSAPEFAKNKDGSVSYKYTVKNIVYKAHGGKMISPDKNDIYQRTTFESGLIMRDGLIKRNKSTKEETLIKRGKR